MVLGVSVPNGEGLGGVRPWLLAAVLQSLLDLAKRFVSNSNTGWYSIEDNRIVLRHANRAQWTRWWGIEQHDCNILWTGIVRASVRG
jgi:hypothetical protein